MKNKILAITSGEPAGIGVDICLDVATWDLPCRVVVLGDIDLLRERALRLNKKIILREFNAFLQPEKNTLEVLPIRLKDVCVAGQGNPNNAPYVLELLDRAFDGIVQNEFAAVITAPVHKGLINDFSGSLKFFSGHTEYLAEKSNTRQVVMMLAGGGMRVALLTTHLPLRDVPHAITTDLIHSVTRIIHHDLQTKFGIERPKILLAGLNPHAGEKGYLGREELDIMQPAAQKLREQGIDISDPLPADTLFQPFLLNQADVVLAAYHDQGLPVLKHASFGNGVNITLGLPFIRTSVDHGTAFNLAATGKADSGSLKAAIETAWQMVLAQK